MSKLHRIVVSLLVVSALLGAQPTEAQTNREFLQPMVGDLPPDGRGGWTVVPDYERLLRLPLLLELETPDGLNFELRRTDVKRRARHSVTWIGEVRGGEGFAVFTVENAVLAGTVITPFGHYRVEPFGATSTFLRRVDEEPTCSVSTASVPAPKAGADDSLPLRALDPAPPDPAANLDLMVVYTPGARDYHGGRPAVVAEARHAVDLANLIFERSLLPQRVHLAHIALAPFDDTGDTLIDIVRVKNDSQVALLRDKHQADIVSLFTDRSDYGGRGYLMTTLSTAFAPYAFNVCAGSVGTTLAHEIGHNMGMHHTPEHAESTPMFPFAYGHAEQGYTTIMGCCGGVSYNYSSPEVNFSFSGQTSSIPSGIENERDNARVARITAPYVANFRLSGVVFRDNFDAGFASAWRGKKAGLVEVEPGLGGSEGALGVPLDGTAKRRFLRHRKEGSGDRLVMEFDLTARDVDLAQGETDILVLLGRGARLLRAAVAKAGAGTELRLYAKENGSGYELVGSAPLRNRPPLRLTVEWQKNSAPGVADGYVRLLSQGQLKAQANGLLNDNFVAKEVRLGLPSGSAGNVSAGLILIDNYKAKR